MKNITLNLLQTVIWNKSIVLEELPKLSYSNIEKQQKEGGFHIVS